MNAFCLKCPSTGKLGYFVTLHKLLMPQKTSITNLFLIVGKGKTVKLVTRHCWILQEVSIMLEKQIIGSII